MKTTFLKRTAAASLSVVLAASVPFTVLADQTDPNVAYEQEQQLLSDGHLDYGEIEGRVKNYYGPMKSAYDMAKGMVEDQADIAVNERIMANPRRMWQRIWQRNRPGWIRRFPRQLPRRCASLPDR